MADSKSNEKTKKREQDDLMATISQNLLKMELLLCKLKLLGVEDEFNRSSLTTEPISRYYFATSSNTSQQFWTMVNLASWLIRKCGNNSYTPPKEDDDPNSVVNNLLEEIKRMGIKVGFSSSRLKVGSGEQCIRLLTTLADEALEKIHFKFQRPVVDSQTLQETMTDQQNYQEVMPELYVEEESEEQSSDVDAAETLINLAQHSHSVPAVVRGKQMSDDELQTFQQELERVTPQLKITIAQESENWQNFGKVLSINSDTMAGFNESLFVPLTQLSVEIDQAMRKIESRENHINERLEHDLTEIQKARNQLAEIKETYRTASYSLTEKSTAYDTIKDKLEETKESLEERMTQLADGEPLVKVKQAITRLKEDIIILQLKITIIQKRMYQAQLNRHRVGI